MKRLLAIYGMMAEGMNDLLYRTPGPSSIDTSTGKPLTDKQKAKRKKKNKKAKQSRRKNRN